MGKSKDNIVSIFRPEERALIFFARQDISNHDIQELKALFDQDLDYEYFIYIAKSHGIAPIIGHHLQSNENVKTVLKFADKEFKKQMIISNLFAQLHNKRMYKELERIKVLFDEHDLEFVILKGPGLAKSIYRSPGIRTFGDLDLLISPTDVYNAHSVLLEDGYTAYGFQGQPVSEEEVVARMNSSFHLYPYGKEHFVVELHQYGDEYEIDFGYVYQDAKEVKLCDEPMLIPNEIDYFIHACAHFVQHRKQATIPILQGLIDGNNMKQLMDIREIYLSLKGREKSISKRINDFDCHEVVDEAIGITEKFYGKFSQLYSDIIHPSDIHYWRGRNWGSHFERRFFTCEEERVKIIEKSKEFAIGKVAYKCPFKDNASKNEIYKIPSIYANERDLKYLLEKTQNLAPLSILNPNFNICWDMESFYFLLQISNDSLDEQQAHEYGYQLLFGFKGEVPKVVFIKPLQSGEHSVFLWQENYADGCYIPAKVHTSYEQNVFKINTILPWSTLFYKPQLNDKIFFDVTVRTAKQSQYHEEHIVSWSTGRYFLSPWADKCDHSIINSIELVG